MVTLNNQKVIYLVFAIFCLLLSNIAMAQVQDILHSKDAIYIEIGDCVQQYEYSYTDKKSYKTAYYDYHVALNNYETAIFKVSKYATETVNINQLPNRNILTCTSSLAKIFDEALLDAVRKSEKDVYIIRKTNQGYEVGRAINAAYTVYLSNDKYYRYVGKEYAFDYDGTKDYDPGAELLQNPQQGMGNFAYRSHSPMNCLQKVDFMRIPVNFMKSTDIEHVMGIGLVREYSDNMERRLIAIDGKAYEMIIAEKCNITPTIETVVSTDPKIEKDVNLGTEMASRSGDDVQVKPVLSQPVSRNTTTTPTLSKPVVSAPTVTDATDVANDFGDIEEDFVEPFEGTARVEPDLKELIESEGQTTKSGTTMTTTTKDGVTVEAEYQPTTEKMPVLDGQTKGAKYHTVKQGETLYRISKQYGITVDKLKKMNQLKTNTIEIDQKLRVE